MPTFYWNVDSNLVSAEPNDQGGLQFQGTRGDCNLRLIVQQGDVNSLTSILLDPSQVVGIALRDPLNFGASYAAGPVVLTRGATAADGYIGTLSTDTTYVQNVMHVGDSTQLELPEYDLNAVFYAAPAVGSAAESIPFDWKVQPSFYRSGTPPADIVETWPTAAALTAAVAAAAAAVLPGSSPTFGSVNITGSATFAGSFGFPSGAALLKGGSPLGLALLTTNSSSYLTPLSLTAGQSVRLNAGGTAFEGFAPEASANKGAASGYCPLDGTAKVPAANLPSYVDDVLEFANVAALPATGESGKIYVTLDTNFEYRWSGSTYIQLVSSPGTTDALVEGSTNLYFTPARAVAAVAGSFHPVSYTSGGGLSGNGTAIATSGGASLATLTGGPTTVPQSFISDTSGTIVLSFSADASAGTLVATITFAASYTTTPGRVQCSRVPTNSSHGASPIGASTGTPALLAVYAAGTLKFYAAGDGVANGSTLAYQYYIPPV